MSVAVFQGLRSDELLFVYQDKDLLRDSVTRKLCLLPPHHPTSIMDKRESIVTVDDALELRPFWTQAQIWTARQYALQSHDKRCAARSADTQMELENFPLHTIQMCQAVLNQTRYPSVLLLAEMVHADIDSAIGDNKHGKKMRLQTL
ncbi:unnamed protein product, partial [Pleuronectes platessa]